MAALTGVMIMVAFGTFKWATFSVINKMPKQDVFIVITVTLITVLMRNLALAVVVAVVISSLIFAWENAKLIKTKKHIDDTNIKHYKIFGPLYFGSTNNFIEMFDIHNDPKEVIVDFTESRISDMSAIDAVNKLTERYSKLGNTFSLCHLSDDCRQLLINADKVIVVNVIGDPAEKIITK